MTRKRPPWWLFALVVLVVGGAAVGNLATGWRGREDPPPTTVPEPTLQSLVRRSTLIVTGRVGRVDRLGEARDPAVDATVAVGERLKGTSAPTVRVYDKDFKVNWRTDDDLLLFLRPNDNVATAARIPWRVVGRYGMLGERLSGSFTLAEVREAVSS